MKLNLKQIQALEFILNKLNTRYKFISENEQLNLIVKINNSNDLWQGNFTIYSNHHISNQYVDFDGYIESRDYSINELFKVPSDFLTLKCNHLTLDTFYLLLPELISSIKDIDTSCINLNSVLFNATNLNANIFLPYLLLNETDEFEVVSVVTKTTDECTHS